jgi:hypothetical protein
MYASGQIKRRARHTMRLPGCLGKVQGVTFLGLAIQGKFEGSSGFLFCQQVFAYDGGIRFTSCRRTSSTSAALHFGLSPKCFRYSDATCCGREEFLQTVAHVRTASAMVGRGVFDKVAPQRTLSEGQKCSSGPGQSIGDCMLATLPASHPATTIESGIRALQTAVAICSRNDSSMTFMRDASSGEVARQPNAQCRLPGWFRPCCNRG